MRGAVFGAWREDDGALCLHFVVPHSRFGPVEILLGDLAVEALRRLLQEPNPPRDRGEAAAVNGLTAVGQEDTPKR